MLKQACLLGTAALLAGGHALAVKNYVHVDYGTAVSSNGQDGYYVSSDWTGDWKDDAPAQKTIIAPEDGKELFSADLSSEGTAEHGSVQAATEGRWREPSIPGFNMYYTHSRAEASSSGNSFQNGAGRVRFFLDYSLTADGVGAEAILNFFGAASQVQNHPTYPINYQTDGVYEKIVGTADGPITRSGSWASDWFYFSNTDAVKAINPHGHAFHWHGGIETKGEVQPGLYHDLSGAYRAYGTLNFRYEVAPIPEPETYALLATGLSAVAYASRARQRKQKPAIA